MEQRRQRRRVDAEDAGLQAAEDDERVRQSIDALFNFAVSNFRKAQPPRGLFSDRCALYDFQQEALGWMLYREQFVTTAPVGSTKEWIVLDDGNVLNRPTNIQVSVPLAVNKCQAERIPTVDSVNGGMNLTSMGLGKTLQMIALMVTNPRKAGLGTLIIMPPILLQQWETEIKRCAPRLKVYVLHGADRDARLANLQRYDVVLTSYSTFAIEMGDDAFARLFWWRVILDEAHEIRNAETKQAQACHRVEARHRFCMTGTPVQNDWRDIFSLLKFLRVRPYGEFDAWMQLIETPIKKGTSVTRENALTRLRSLISRLAIRHTKTQDNPDATIQEGATLASERPERVYELTNTTMPRRRDLMPEVWRVDRVRFDSFTVEPRETRFNKTPSITVKFRDYYDNPNVLELRKQYVYLPPLRIEYKSIGNNFTRDTYNAYYRCVYEALRDNRAGDLTFVLIKNLRRFCVHPRLVPEPASPRCAGPKPPGNVYGKEYIKQVKKKRMSFESSAKLDLLVDDLGRVTELDAGAKSVVFSEWNDVLDLTEMRLQQAGWYSERDYVAMKEPKPQFARRYVRIDGTTKDDTWSLEKLSKEEGVKLILLNITVGGVGLNLARASNVFFLEPSFNPGLTSQAIDRVSRIGQQRSMYVTMYVTDDTIEEKIVDLANYKKRIAEQTLRRAPATREVVADLV